MSIELDKAAWKGRSRMKGLGACVALFVCSGAASSQQRSAPMPGSFQGSDLTLRIERNLNTAIRIGGRCRGSIAGPAQQVDRSTLVLSKKEPHQEKACRVTIKFAQDFRSAVLEESECSYYHGAGCSFIGSVQRTR
jgi:hypothetical protein